MQIKWKGNKFEQAIIKKAECSLIHNRIKCTNIKINHFQTKTSLQQKLDEPTFTNLQNIIFNNKEKTFLSIPKFLPAPISHMSARSLHKNASSFWNSLSPMASSASTRNSMNNYRVQPWVHLSPLSLQISTWNTLNPQPFPHLQH